MHLTWIINNICNRACDYCPSSLHDGQNHHYEWQHAERFVTELQGRHDRIHVTISGGEPTMSPWLEDLVDLLRARNNTVGITSNGARTLRYYRQLAPKLRYICLSYHPDPEDPDFLAKALESSRHCLTKINVMMPADHWAQALEFYQQLSQHPSLTYEPVRITEWHPHAHGQASRAYTPEQLAWFEQNKGRGATRDLCDLYEQQQSTPTPLQSQMELANGTGVAYMDPTYLINTDQNHFAGWRCSQGLESLFVQYTGQIGAANCGQNRNLGWIQHFELIQWPTAPVVCREQTCICSSDIYITKRAPNKLPDL
jgi:organic radical activating enzyme